MSLECYLQGQRVYVGGASLIAKNKVLTVAHKFNVIQDVNNPVSSLFPFIQQRLETHESFTTNLLKVKNPVLLQSTLIEFFCTFTQLSPQSIFDFQKIL